ncbi:MAG: response regulator [Richelia sp.]|nr:response regulator [Richelia sp.]
MSLAIDQEVETNLPHQFHHTSLQKKWDKIVCIDDSPTVLNSIKSFLYEELFSVIAIKDPLKALMQIIRTKPDLILVDITMPGLDGYELCSLPGFLSKIEKRGV